ncbi:hypothetical protein GCM10011494_39570 [Novosphingobium endophyticum]|uniref:ThuA-like domain-containing protein n=1 Tax=Novosphingobium endophyticum TaxID=1955250 RepID=A0A916X6D6_9SPHN|nr:ThuA domain-containing protein [Novosphingobium endophyticum]GGC16763.1 hypothetical protein GCM10011494_39570 [Novosphingobium endophyticum]
MKKTLLSFLATGATILAYQPAVAATVDCPLRDEPFSVKSPLIDVLLSPAARAVLEQAAPGRVAKIPPRFASATPPTFAAILSVEMAGMMTGIPADKLPVIDAELRALPVTEADKEARCARYDNDVPNFDMPKGKPRLLVFEKITGFRDGPSVDAAREALTVMAKRNGWAIVSTEKGGAINEKTLRKFDAIIWNNVSGDVLTLTQRRALQDFLKRGGGFVAVHGAAGDPVYFWDWYIDGLIGARFKGHIMNPQFQNARVQVNKDHPVAKSLPTEWRMKDEWYSFSTNPRAAGAKVVLTLDESSYSPKGMQGDLSMGDHPIAWTNCYGKGRTFYSAIGHMPETYSEPHHVALLESAIRWASNRKNDCKQ